MIGPEMTLAAALRDAAHQDGAVRIAGLRNLAPALLLALDRPGPACVDDREHPDAAATRALLRRGLDDALPDARGYAAIGLATLGATEIIEAVTPWLQDDRERDHADAVWLREAGVIALSYVGVAIGERDAAARERVLLLLRTASTSSRPELRDQAAVARVELDDPEIETALRDALARAHGDEREPIAYALSLAPALGPATLDALADALAQGSATDAAALELALVLAAHARPEATPTLVAALTRRFDRDRALEALAAAGVPDLAAAQATARLLRPWVPPVTRVRAAYALCRIAPDGSSLRVRGQRGLAWLAWHPRGLVRAAVADAHAALAALKRP